MQWGYIIPNGQITPTIIFPITYRDDYSFSVIKNAGEVGGQGGVYYSGLGCYNLSKESFTIFCQPSNIQNNISSVRWISIGY